jgi:hypothetical protein
MHICKEYFRGLLLFLVILFAFGAVAAQDIAPAVKIYNDWKAKHLTDTGIVEDRYIGIGFAVSKNEKSGTRVNAAIGVGSQITELGEIEFSVQPLALKQSAKGKNIFMEIGSSSVLRLPESKEVERQENGIVAIPQISIKTPAEAGAIRITVKEHSSGNIFTVTLPLRDTTSTAVLGGTIEQSTERFGKCVWFTGDCGGGCGGLYALRVTICPRT